MDSGYDEQEGVCEGAMMSCVMCIAGPFLVLGGIFMAGWWEFQYVAVQKDLDLLSTTTVEIKPGVTTVVPANDGKPILFNGKLGMGTGVKTISAVGAYSGAGTTTPLVKTTDSNALRLDVSGPWFYENKVEKTTQGSGNNKKSVYKCNGSLKWYSKLQDNRQKSAGTSSEQESCERKDAARTGGPFAPKFTSLPIYTEMNGKTGPGGSYCPASSLSTDRGVTKCYFETTRSMGGESMPSGPAFGWYNLAAMMGPYVMDGVWIDKYASQSYTETNMDPRKTCGGSNAVCTVGTPGSGGTWLKSTDWCTSTNGGTMYGLAGKGSGSSCSAKGGASMASWGYVSSRETTGTGFSTVTILGVQAKITAGATINEWTGPNSGYKFGEIVRGTKTKKEVFDHMANKWASTAMVMRFVSFAIIWIGFRCLLEPFVWMADMFTDVIDAVSCNLAGGLNDMMDDCFQAIACCITCPPACLIWLIVFTIAWVAARPTYLVLVVIVLCVFGALYQKNKKERTTEWGDPRKRGQQQQNNQGNQGPPQQQYNNNQGQQQNFQQQGNQQGNFQQQQQGGFQQQGGYNQGQPGQFQQGQPQQQWQGQPQQQYQGQPQQQYQGGQPQQQWQGQQGGQPQQQWQGQPQQNYQGQQQYQGQPQNFQQQC